MLTDLDLRWEPHFTGYDSIWYLMWGTDQLARVARRVDGRTWLSEVARHRRIAIRGLGEVTNFD